MKWVNIFEEKYTYTLVYGSEGKPYYLPRFIFHRFFLEKFNILTQVSKVEIKKQLIDFNVDNVRCDTIAREQYVNLPGIIDELIAIKVKGPLQVPFVDKLMI